MRYPLIRGAGLATAIAALCTPLPAPLAAQEFLPPAKVTVQASGGAVTVAWAPVASKGISYRVVRSLSAKERGRDLTTPITVASFVDAKVEPGMTYFYRVIAVYRDGTSAAAEPVGFTVPVGLATQTLAPVPVVSGLMLPLQEPPATPSGTFTAEPTMAPLPAPAGLARTTFCNPGQTLPGPAPTSFLGVTNASPTMGARWPVVPGAVAYVVERSVDGANAWTVAGSTCGGPSPIGTVTYYQEGPSVRFIDFSGGIVPGTKYVYVIKAIGAAGETGWNSTRWTAPGLWYAEWKAPIITGSTVVIRWEQGYYSSGRSRSPDKYRLSSSYGWGVRMWCSSSCSQTIHGVPIGTHTFTLTSEWTSTSAPFPDGVYASFSRTMTITIQP
jgi:hypothetical protein